jgi:hypothetical protein
LAQFNDLRDTWDVKALTALLSLYDATFLRNRALILRTLLAQKNGGVKDIQGSAEVLYEGPVVDWSVNEGAWDRAEPPSEYQISVVKENENQFCIRLAPKHERPDDLDGKHQLAVTIEVDKDVPHVMLSNDIYGDQVLLAHTTRNGLYIEPATANNPERADSEEAAALEYNKRGWFLVNEVD